ncbi:MAG: ester cyclase, partial [Ignavibacteriae bacterium]|nr:ester cyclase [Ignavibacteriota bacterium]
AEETQAFWPAWFAAFPEMDYEVTRTVAAPSVVVTQWVFTGTQTRPLGPPVFDPPLPPSGRTIRFRGVTVYDVAENNLIQRETTYMDLATLMVELGVTP